MILEDSSAAEQVAHALLLELGRVIRSGDTTALRSLLADVQFGPEQALAARAGCPTPEAALQRIRSAAKVVVTNEPIPLALDMQDVVRTAGTWEARGAVVRLHASRLMYAPLKIVITFSEGVPQLRQAEGLLTGLCGFAASW